MKHIQVITEKQYIKAWLKLLTEAAQKPRQINTNLFGTADENNMNEYKILDLTFIIGLIRSGSDVSSQLR